MIILRTPGDRRVEATLSRAEIFALLDAASYFESMHDDEWKREAREEADYAGIGNISEDDIKAIEDTCVTLGEIQSVLWDMAKEERQ